MKKYIISYVSGATGYGWEEKVNTIEEVENIVNEFKNIYTAKLSVFDNQLDDFIYYKFSLESKPQVDFIYNYKRDLRVKDRVKKIFKK